jgi:UDP-N-acetylglucosamine diphosphorylase/glucosamine-1-phosphate N-acetyltransferase
MPPRLLIYEDAAVDQLRPLTWTRPAWDVRSGIATLAEKIAAAYPAAEVRHHVRPYLTAAVMEEAFPQVVSRREDAEALAGPLLCVNGRVQAGEDFATRVPLDGPDERFVCGGDVVAVRLADGRRVGEAIASGVLDAGAFADLPAREVDVPVVAWPWDLIRTNAREIIADFRRFYDGGRIEGDVHPRAVLEGDRIHVAAGSRIQPGAVLLAEDGPIVIGPGTLVMAGAVIQGPVAVGADCRVRPLARLCEGTTVGPLCKVGGEVEASILHACSSKQHDGFMGHSYVGAWCNLGADTNTSDLKNTYAPVTMTVDGREIETGCRLLGLMMGDHSKCGINTMFNTGTIVGVGCNLYGGDYQRRDVPSFTWGGRARLGEHDFETFCSTAARAMARRDKQFTHALRDMLEYVYHQTRGARQAATRRGSL